MVGRGCCMRAFSHSGERGLLFMAVLELLVVVASFVAECGLQGARAPVFVAHRL